MSQISTPIRIVLVAAVVFMAAWFTVLKPKDAVVAPPGPATPAAPTAPGTAATVDPSSAAGKFQATAKAGAEKAERDAYGAANAGIEDGATGTAAAPAAAAPVTTQAKTQAVIAELPPIEPKSLVGLPRSVRDGLTKRKVVVLAVLNTESKPWAEMAEDDRAVRKALRRVNRYDGQVIVHSAPMAKLAKYDGLLKALNVVQSPTVVVIDHNRKGVALTGYVDRASINQAIADAHRGSVQRELSDSFLRKVNATCGHYSMRFDRLSVAAPKRQVARLATKRRASFRRIAAPAKWRSLKGKIVRAAGKPSANALGALDTSLNAAGLGTCAVNRTR